MPTTKPETTESPSTLSPADPYQDETAIVSRIKEHLDKVDKLRWAFERLWFRSLLYYLGNQWIVWDTRSRRWREKRLRRWVPRPVTNRFASTVDTICAAIQAFKVMPSAWPASQDAKDIAAADVADKIIPVIDEEIEVHKVRALVAKWMTLNADCFVLPMYDTEDDSLGRTSIPKLACDMCGHVDMPLGFEQACPQCGQTPPMVAPAIDPDGQPIVESFPVGRLTTEIFSPLELYLNLDVVQLGKQHRFTAFKALSLETIKTKWPERGKQVQPEGDAATRTAKYFIEAISYSTEDAGYNLTGASTRDRATIYYHFEMPTEKYPEGLWAVMSADEVLLESGPSPYFEMLQGSKKYFWPLAQFPYNNVPGRLYSKTPVYDLLPKQDQLNRLESLIELATMKGTYGTWLLPAGSSISQTSGEPGTHIKWTPTGSGGAKPEVITTAPFPDILMAWKEAIQQDFEELAGTYDAMKGQVPRGVSAGYAIQLLTERSYGRFATVFAGWESGWTDLYKILLKLFRTYASEDRIRRVRAETGSWEIEHFRGADIGGSVDVRVEGGASRPRSKIAEQALLESLVKIGVVNPQDPEQRYEIAQMFGMAYVLGAQDEDQRHAAREWEEFLAWDGTTPQRPDGTPAGPMVHVAVDNHIVHISDHRKRAKTDTFDQLPPMKRLVWENHILDHVNHAMGAMPMAPGVQPGPPKPVTSKANETSDKTMDTVRSGGNATLGGGGKNQYVTPPGGANA